MVGGRQGDETRRGVQIMHTYSASDYETGAAAFDNVVLHSPGPIPVNLNGRLPVNKDKVARRKLLIPKIGPVKVGRKKTG